MLLMEFKWASRSFLETGLSNLPPVELALCTVVSGCCNRNLALVVSLSSVTHRLGDLGKPGDSAGRFPLGRED